MVDNNEFVLDVNINDDLMNQMSSYLDTLNTYTNIMLVMLCVITLLHFFRLIVINKWLKLIYKNYNFNILELVIPFFTDLKLLKLFKENSNKKFFKIIFLLISLVILSFIFPYCIVFLLIHIYLLKGKLLRKYLIRKSYLKYYYFSMGILFIYVIYKDLKFRNKHRKGVTNFD